MIFRRPGSPMSFFIFFAVGLTMLVQAGALLAQTPPSGRASAPGDPGTPPIQMPGLPSMPGSGAAVPVVADTARVALELVEGAAVPVMLAFVADTVMFGEVTAFVCEYPAATAVPATEDMTWEADWLSVAGGVSREHLDRLEGLAQSGGESTLNSGALTRLVIPVRVYRTDPFRLVFGEIETPVIHVRGRTTDLAETAAIRAPRAWGWNIWTVAALALGATLLVLLLWRLMQRRNQIAALEDWVPPAPAWIMAAERLRTLLESHDLDRGMAREFLDALASIVRGFAGDRYGIAAREMTGREIVQACRDRGFDVSHPRRLARLVEEADRRRYDPEPVSIAWCRDQVSLLIEQMSAIRVIPCHSPVPAEIRLAAEKSWSVLKGYRGETGGGPDETLSGEGA